MLAFCHVLVNGMGPATMASVGLHKQGGGGGVRVVWGRQWKEQVFLGLFSSGFKCNLVLLFSAVPLVLFFLFE